MKIRTNCPHCGVDNEELLELSDVNTYVTTCSAGHTNKLSLMIHKFELLFELGGMAVVDGYYREAVSNFAASLERFFEFYIRYTVSKKGDRMGDFDAIWKRMSNDSQSQLGAFFICYYLNNQRDVDFGFKLDKWKQFRNEATHKGQIPSRKDTIVWGGRLLKFIKELIVEMKQQDFTALVFVANEPLIEAHESQPTADGVNHIGKSMLTAINLHWEIVNPREFRAYDSNFD